MPGTNAGTGHRLFARCSKCASWESEGRLGFKISPTGARRVRRMNNAGSGRVDGTYQYEYRCPDCGHVGWSRHSGLARKYRAEFGSKAGEENESKA